ncbi:MAG: TetR family transcriptional regulator [Planctomycetota bacterium]|nr:MAG: TetR family transcriptional regulator [Planctomycetota bacterium]
MAPTSARKQREIQDREALILQVARGMLLERGYLGLTMDRIAAATEYSKGTIYQHFANKEDLLAALAADTMAARVSMFQRGAAIDGRPREKFFAIGLAEELFVRLNPEHFRSQQILCSVSFREKAQECHLAPLEGQNQICLGVSEALIRDAVACGDLFLPEDMEAADLAIQLYALYTGTFTIVEAHNLPEHEGFQRAPRFLHRGAHRLLDGYGWKPLSQVWDYQATAKRVYREAFPKEARLLGLLA